MMRVNRKPQIKSAFSSLLTAVFMYDWDNAVMAIDQLEDSLVQHRLSRQMNIEDIENIRERCRIIRMYLQEPNHPQDKKRIVTEHILDLIKSTSVKNNPGNHPLLKLREIYGEIKEDWNAFWADPGPGTVDSLSDDLDALESLEPALRGGDEDIYKQFRRILEARAKCVTLFPMMSAVGPGALPRAEQRREIMNAFQDLFRELEKLMAPAHFQFTTEEPGGVPVPKIVPIGRTVVT